MTKDFIQDIQRDDEAAHAEQVQNCIDMAQVLANEKGLRSIAVIYVLKDGSECGIRFMVAPEDLGEIIDGVKRITLTMFKQERAKNAG